MSSVLVVVDLQNDFCNGVFKNPQVEKLIPEISRFIDLNENKYEQIVFTLDTHEEKNYNEPFPIHCLKYSHGWDLISPLDRY